MSRGFVKEDDQEEVPIIPERAPLPNGAINYVTPKGYQALLYEKESLETERQNLPHTQGPERRIAANVIQIKLNRLTDRINSAQVIESQKDENEIRFGAIVKLRFIAQKMTRTFQIVGVDEADVSGGKIAFTSPIAQAISGKKKGEIAILELGNESREIEILEFSYD